MECEFDVLGGYLPSFVQHLKDTAARLRLRIGSQASEDQISAQDVVAEEPTLSGWSPAEQDAFFRAVSVHSRWRPDLIAACVPTKTEWEVWMYLEALEEGAAALASQQDDEDLDMEMQVDSAVRSRSGSDVDEDENMCAPALEVSQDWIDAEERMAAWIIEEEHLTLVESDAATDTEDVEDEPAKRKRGRPRGTRKGRARSRVKDQTVSNKTSPPPDPRPPSAEPASTPRSKPCQDSSSACARKRDALMHRLEVPHLLVLDSILRESEEATKKGKSREDSITTTNVMEHGDDGTPRTDASSLSDRIAGPPGTSHVSEPSSNAVINPILLALSGAAGPEERQVPSESTATSVTHAYDPGPFLFPSTSFQPLSSEVFSQPGMSGMFASPHDNVPPTHPGPTTNAEPDLSLFSPRSRRRIQKRLYMRRKRALLRGNGNVPEGTVDTGIERLKPGKKAKSEQHQVSVVSISEPCSEIPSDAEAESPEKAPKKNKPGLTLPYKLKTQFAELGIDATYLRCQGMDLLNLGALGKLMGLYSSLEHGEEVDGSKAIDAQLIQHLQTAMVSFVTDVIHRAIVWREREIRLKQRSQAWRHGDQMTIGAVEHAVEAIGARYHSHKAYFRSLEACRGPSEAPENAPEEEPNSTEVSLVGTDHLPGFSPHRDVCTPLVYPPSAWGMRPLTCLSRTYEREATRTRRGTSADVEDALMSDTTDEEEDALGDEDAADERDLALSATQEAGLWVAVLRNK